MSARRANVRLALAILATAVVAACDRAPTEPVAGMRGQVATLNIEGDTLSCRNGWQIVNGRYECNAQ